MRLMRRNVVRLPWLHGLLLALALLGHDLLMATLAVAAPMPIPAVGAHLALDHAGDRAPVANQAHDATPAHPGPCGTAAEAIAAVDAPRDDAAVAVPIRPDDGENRTTTPEGADHWLEPLWPPGTLRAWLQIYRI